jgi:hypothetical protein
MGTSAVVPPMSAPLSVQVVPLGFPPLPVWAPALRAPLGFAPLPVVNPLAAPCVVTTSSVTPPQAPLQVSTRRTTLVASV